MLRALRLLFFNFIFFSLVASKHGLNHHNSVITRDQLNSSYLLMETSFETVRQAILNHSSITNKKIRQRAKDVKLEIFKGESPLGVLFACSNSYVASIKIQENFLLKFNTTKEDDINALLAAIAHEFAHVVFDDLQDLFNRRSASLLTLKHSSCWNEALCQYGLKSDYSQTFLKAKSEINKTENFNDLYSLRTSSNKDFESIKECLVKSECSWFRDRERRADLFAAFLFGNEKTCLFLNFFENYMKEHYSNADMDVVGSEFDSHDSFAFRIKYLDTHKLVFTLKK